MRKTRNLQKRTRKTSNKNIFRGISGRSHHLLNRTEDLDVEFKETVSSLDTTDLIAFANSPSGGAILIGVREVRRKKQIQGIKITGCDVSDRAKQAILNRAESCVPPVAVQVYVENESKIPFLRIEIPTGSEKPYCTSGGTYKIRGDGRTKALLPGLLLAMFVESESELFLARYREATIDMQDLILDSTRETNAELSGIASDLLSTEDNIKRSLDNISAMTDEAADLADDAMTFGRQALEFIERIEATVEYGVDGIERNYSIGKALLAKFDIEDPEMTERRTAFKECVRGIYSGEIKQDIDSLMEGFVSKRANIDKQLLRKWIREVERDFKK